MMRQKPRGITLLEMVVVLMIIAMMASLAVALLQGASKSLSVPATATHLDSLARTARLHARLQGAPAWILFDTRERQISVLAKEPYGMWHFERMTGTGRGSTTAGAYGRDASFQGSQAAAFAAGKVGQGVVVNSDTVIELPNIPFWHPRQGVSIEFWINRAESSSDQTLLTLNGSPMLTLEQIGASIRDCARCGKKIPAAERQCPLCGETLTAIARGRPAGAFGLRARIAGLDLHSFETVPAQRWVRVGVYYAAGEARIYVDDMLRAAKRGGQDWKGSAKLAFGARSGGFRGVLDELSVSMIVPRESFDLPREVHVQFQGSSKPDSEGRFVIHFDPEGRLEEARHTAPVEMHVTGPENQLQGVRVELTGNLVQFTPAAAPPPKGTASGP